MFDWFETISDFYIAGYNTNDQVKVFVEKNKITAEQYKEITGIDYVA